MEKLSEYAFVTGTLPAMHLCNDFDMCSVKPCWGNDAIVQSIYFDIYAMLAGALPSEL